MMYCTAGADKGVSHHNCEPTGSRRNASAATRDDNLALRGLLFIVSEAIFRRLLRGSIILANALVHYGVEISSVL